MRTTITRTGPVRGLQLAALAAATSLALPVAAAAAAPPALHIASTVAIPGAMAAASLGMPVATEAPDGTVYVATVDGGQQTVRSVSLTGARHVVDRVTGVGTITALAADATYLYAGTPLAISAYRRTDGALVQRWPLSPSPRQLSQLAVAGNRVWGLLTPLGFTRKPSSLVELDPTSPIRVRTVNGVPDTTSIAATSSAIYYVSDKSSTVVRLTNAGVRTTAPTHEVVNQTLSGPAAIQALLVDGSAVVVRFDAGQGLDATTFSYNASTLAGPSASHGAFDAGSALGKTSSLGLLESGIPGGNSCVSTLHPCLVRYAIGSGGPVAPALSLPYDGAGAPLGPFPAVVATQGNHLSVLRIS